MNDTETLQLIRDFLRAEKPQGIIPIDILNTIHYITRKTLDHGDHTSHLTLARSFGCDFKTVQRSQRRLRKRGWLGLSAPAIQGKALDLSVNASALPVKKSEAITVSDDAKKLAVKYQLQLQNQGRRRFPKLWLQNQEYTAQRMITDVGMDEAAELIAFALTVRTAGFYPRAHTSLYRLFMVWSRLKKAKADYEKKRKAIEQMESEINAAIFG